MIRGLSPNPDARNNTYYTYFHGGKQGIKGYIMLEMIVSLLKTHADNYLVYEKNYGSESSVWVEKNYMEAGIGLFLMTPKNNPMKLEVEIDRLLTNFVFKYLHEKTSRDISNVLKSVLFEKAEFDDDLKDVTSKLWRQLIYELFYNETKNFYEVATEIDRETFLDFVRDLFVNKQQRISLEMFNHKNGEIDLKWKGEQSLNLGNLEYEVVDTAYLTEVRKRQFMND